MAINLPNFLQAETRGYGPEGLLENLMQGYQASQMPTNMALEQDKERQLIEQLMHGNRGQAIKNQYEPRNQELGQEEKRKMIEQLILGNQSQAIANEFQPRLLGQKERQGEADILQRELMNKYLPAKEEANIEHLRNQSKYAHLAHMTQAERDVMAMIGPENLRTPEGQKLVAALNRIPPSEIGQGNESALPKGAKSMAHWPQAAISKEIDRQNAELDKIQNIKVMKSGIQDARQIMDAYPDMWKDFSIILADPENQNKISRMAASFTDEDRRTAAIQFAKITSGIINRNAETLGARGTNVRVRLLQKEKPDLFNTPAGNKYMFDRLDEEFDPQLAREPALLAAQGEYALPRTYEHEKKTSKHLVGNNTVTPRQAENRRAGNSEQMGGLVPGFYKGKPVMIHPDNMDQFKRKGGLIP